MKRNILSPAFSEFLWSIILLAPADSLRQLPPKHRKIFANQRSARSWVESCSLEDCFSVLSLLGLKWYLCLYNSKNFGEARYIRDVFDKFDESKKATELSSIVENQLYVSSHSDLLHYLGIRATMIHTDSYQRNLELAKAGHHFTKLRNKLGSEVNETLRKDSAAAEYLAKTALSGISAFQVCDSIFQVSQIDMQILLYLYPMRHLYIPHEKLRSTFPQFKAAKISVASKRLVDNQLLELRPGAKDRQYRISGLGIQKVNEINHYILKHNAT